MLNRTLLLLFYTLFLVPGAIAQKLPELQTVADNGWANNSVNTVIFRKNSLVTYQNTQFIGYYDADQYLVLGKRSLNSKHWTILRSPYKGDAADAHKSISIMVDGKGYLHVVWGQHNNGLNYARAVKPGVLDLGAKEQMLGIKESKVTYPEFYKLATGDLLFFYRDGGSGNGDLMINRYDIKKRSWSRVQDNLIDGQGQRNAYWQTVIDQKGTIHLSWVWRESPDVASNHDLCYAKSTDGGLTWKKSTGAVYSLPINESNAEYACIVPQNSELINQTSMSADEAGHPIIAGYWRDKGSDIPQYHIVYNDGASWSVQNLGFRKTPFTLSGGGTKKIPISRPQIVTWKQNDLLAAALIFRDAERLNKVSVAFTANIGLNQWLVKDLTLAAVGEWEPTYDTELWMRKKKLSLFIQEVVQIDGEGIANNKTAPVQVLDWIPYHANVYGQQDNAASAYLKEGYRLVWSDEFNKDGKPDTTSWKYENGFARNEELQWYQQDNVCCEKGKLIIEGRKENKSNPLYKIGSDQWRNSRKDIEYTSSSINTAGKHTWQYGRFEMRGKIDVSSGLWPAWWMLGTKGEWPSNGEIDIMEYYKGKILANIAVGTLKRYSPEWHSKTKLIKELGGSEWASKFHVWRMDWTEKEISLFVDDELLIKVDMAKLYNKDGSGTHPFKQPHYMLLNLAMGGLNGGPLKDTKFPNRFEVDYVRVYQQN